MKFTEAVQTYFEGKTLELCNFKLITDKWTINFESDDDVFFQRTRNFISSLLRIREIDQFLRGLKLFFANCSKKFYNLLLDVLQQSLLAEQQHQQYKNSNPDAAEAKDAGGVQNKKEVLKHLNSVEEQKSALMTLVLMCC